MRYTPRSLFDRFETRLTRRQPRRPRARVQLSVDQLEDRLTPAVLAATAGASVLPVYSGLVHASTTLSDGSTVTVQSTFNADGSVASQNIIYANPTGGVNTAVATTDTHAADKSLLTTQGTVTGTGDAAVGSFTQTYTEGNGAVSQGGTATLDQ